MIYNVLTTKHSSFSVSKPYILLNQRRDTFRIESNGTILKNCNDWEGLSANEQIVWTKR